MGPRSQVSKKAGPTDLDGPRSVLELSHFISYHPHNCPVSQGILGHVWQRGRLRVHTHSQVTNPGVVPILAFIPPCALGGGFSSRGKC